MVLEFIFWSLPKQLLLMDSRLGHRLSQYAHWVFSSLETTFWIRPSPQKFEQHLGVTLFAQRSDFVSQSLIVCVHAKSLQSCTTLCNPINCRLPDTSVHGILQTRILEWVAMHSSRGLPSPGIKPTSPISPALAGWFLTTSATWESPKAWLLDLNILLYSQQEASLQTYFFCLDIPGSLHL